MPLSQANSGAGKLLMVSAPAPSDASARPIGERRLSAARNSRWQASAIIDVAFGEKVAVPIQGDADRRMAHPRLNRLRVRFGCDRKRNARVPQIIETTLQPGRPSRWAEMVGGELEQAIDALEPLVNTSASFPASVNFSMC